MNQELQPLFNLDAVKVSVGKYARSPKWPRCASGGSSPQRISGAFAREANACKVLGQTGALLRREGLYSLHLTHWRKE